MEEFLWTEKYRPSTVADTIMPSRFKKMFEEFARQKNLPNLILSGGPGCGKTTIARALLEEIGAAYILVNGSLNGNIDTLRTEIKAFASTVSFKSSRKFVILDEADHLTPATQPALRSFMDEFANNCGFILTCNYPDRIIDPLFSRSTTIDFKFTKDDTKEMMGQFIKRVDFILKKENVPYEKAALAEMLKRFFPDMRKIINDLQTYSACGKIDTGIMALFDDTQMQKVVDLMKAKEFTELRKWVAETEIGENDLYKRFYDTAAKYLKPASVPQLVLILAKYSYQSSFCLNKDINLMACLTECMLELEFQ